MNNNKSEQDKKNEEDEADYFMPGGKRRFNMPVSISDSSDSESEPEGTSSRLPNKRDKKSKSHRRPTFYNDPENDISLRNYCYPLVPQANFDPDKPSTSKAAFFSNPNCNELDLGKQNTTKENATTVQCATPEDIKKIDPIQNLIIEPDVKRSDTLPPPLATPGITELKINDELCQLGKRGDILMITENFMTSLSNDLLQAKDMLGNNLTKFIFWANTEKTSYSSTEIIHKILFMLGPESDPYKKVDQVLQEVDDHKTHCINIRRDTIITEIPDQNLQSMLEVVPPSEDYLFDQYGLQAVIKASGGTSSWVKLLEKVNEEKPVKERAPARDPQSCQASQGTNSRLDKNKSHHRNRQNGSRLPNTYNNKIFVPPATTSMSMSTRFTMYKEQQMLKRAMIRVAEHQQRRRQMFAFRWGQMN